MINVFDTKTISKYELEKSTEKAVSLLARENFNAGLIDRLDFFQKFEKDINAWHIWQNVNKIGAAASTKNLGLMTGYCAFISKGKGLHACAVFINLPQHKTSEEILLTLLHELAHANHYMLFADQRAAIEEDDQLIYAEKIWNEYYATRLSTELMVVDGKGGSKLASHDSRGIIKRLSEFAGTSQEERLEILEDIIRAYGVLENDKKLLTEFLTVTNSTYSGRRAQALRINLSLMYELRNAMPQNLKLLREIADGVETWLFSDQYMNLTQQIS